MLDPAPAGLVDRVKRGLLQLRPSEFLVLRFVLRAVRPGDRQKAAVERPDRRAAPPPHSGECQCTRHELMRAAFELADDAEVKAYL
jgi:hypothetical protein